jgi:hypothetical protein
VIATFMTTAVMPTLLHQDPRYFVLGVGGAWHRVAYAATRSFVTLDHSGHRQFNYSDVTGNAIAATAANLYHPVEDRSWSDTTTRGNADDVGCAVGRAEGILANHPSSGPQEVTVIFPFRFS